MGHCVFELYENAAGRQIVGKELGKLLTPRQEDLVARNLERIEEHGYQACNQALRKVRSSKKGLMEIRLTADKLEVRFLMSRERDNTHLLLTCYKEQSNDIPSAKIATAEKRLDEWRSRHQ